MPVSSARKAAYQILLRVESGHAFAVDLLQRPDVSALKEVDRRLATEIVMGVLRWRGELDYRIEQASGKKVKVFDAEVLTILRMGVYQIRFLERVPKRAAVNDAVELTKAARKRSAAGLVNAVLRKCEPPKNHWGSGEWASASAEERESVRRAFPQWLLTRWAATATAGDAAAERLAFASLATPRTTIRVVDATQNREEIRASLAAEGITTSPCAYAAQGLTVESGHIHDAREYQAGGIVIQDEASQLVADLVRPDPGMRVLDLCAAPGIKAGQIATSLGAGTLLACDRSGPRLQTMSRLLSPCLPAQVRLMMVGLDAARPLPFADKFHRILLDAPCSGTGTLARNPEIKWRLHAEDITRLGELQARMLRNALPYLDQDGRLVYATCSLEAEENEGVVETVLRDVRDFRMLTPQELTLQHPRLKDLFDSRGYFRIRPDQHLMDGFSAAVIVRTGPEQRVHLPAAN